MTEPVLVPGTREVRGSLSEPDADGCVVACPPHPRHGGARSDARLRAVADALCARGIACLRFDYGAWDGGRGERIDAESAIGWARERYDRVGLFGYSFGASVALVVAARDPALCAVAVLAPPARIESLDALEAVTGVTAPLLVLYGERDGTVEWAPVVAAARGRGADVVSLPGGHGFTGARKRLAARVAEFFLDRCRE